MLTIDFNYLQIKSGDSLLDVGCGEGRHTIHAAFHFDVIAVGVDLSEKDLRVSQEKYASLTGLNPQGVFQLAIANGVCLPFDSESIDRIICSEVLEHIDSYSAVLAEMKRVLKKDGLLAISVPRAWPEKICWRLSQEYHQVEGGHLRIFDQDQLQQEICALGFTLFKTHYAHALHSPYWWLRCLWWKNQNESRMIALYHKFLVWDLMDKPWLTQTLETLLNPLMGKSVVMYFRKISEGQNQLDTRDQR